MGITAAVSKALAKQQESKHLLVGSKKACLLLTKINVFLEHPNKLLVLLGLSGH